MSESQQAQADNLVGDYKARLGPYVDAMKKRGYFGEAMKKREAEAAAQQQISQEVKQPVAQQPKPQQSVATPAGQQPSMSGVETTGLSDPNSKTGGEGLDGDFLSIESDIAPDPTDRAPDVINASRPTPVEPGLMDQ